MSSPSTFCHFILRKPYHENFSTTFLMALKLQVEKIKTWFSKGKSKKKSRLLCPFKLEVHRRVSACYDQTLIFSKIAPITPQKFHFEASKPRFYV